MQKSVYRVLKAHKLLRLIAVLIAEQILLITVVGQIQRKHIRLIHFVSQKRLQMENENLRVLRIDCHQ